jgi:hypothetical protein
MSKARLHSLQSRFRHQMADLKRRMEADQPVIL